MSKKNPKKRQRYANTTQRLKILERDNYKCQYCGTTLTDATANMDHVVPFKFHGKTTLKNMVACCRPCNRRKLNRWARQMKD